MCRQLLPRTPSDSICRWGSDLQTRSIQIYSKQNRKTYIWNWPSNKLHAQLQLEAAHAHHAPGLRHTRRRAASRPSRRSPRRSLSHRLYPAAWRSESLNRIFTDRTGNNLDIPIPSKIALQALAQAGQRGVPVPSSPPLPETKGDGIMTTITTQVNASQPLADSLHPHNPRR